MDTYNDEDLIILTDENGEESRFELLDMLEFEGKDYIVVIPPEEDADEVLIMQVVPDPADEEMEDYLPVEDEALLQQIFEEFKRRNEDLFEFED